jgi:hypothetical protein
LTLTLPAHKQYFFAVIMFLIMALNGMLFARFQKVQEKLADLVEDRDNEMLFSKKRQEFRSAISSSSNSQIGSPKNQ